MTLSKSPGQALDDYFSDMLADPSDVAPYCPLESKPEALPVRPEPRATFAEPVVESAAEIEQKLKLERLLASARAKVEVAVAEVAAEPLVETVVQVVAEPIVEAAVEPEIAVEAEVVVETVEIAEETVVAKAESVIEFLEWCENGRPQWAQERFEVLLFQVSGLTLAVPLIALGQIQPITDEMTTLFGQADWFMGLQPSPAGKIRTVNTALFVMPERYDPKFVESAKYVVSLSGVPWGLAVDSVNQPISLNVDDVKWRSERSKRPWLAGTVKGHMCALVDIPQMAQMLLDADHSKR